MNLLLTGSTGFLGKIIKSQVSSNFKISSLSRVNSDYCISLEKNVPSFKQIFEIVIHAAGKAHSVPKTNVENQQFYDINVGGTLNLLKGLEESGLPKEFVFISSVSVYGQEIGNNINEDHPLDAKDPYGLSKIEAEKIILDWCKVNNIICTILRLPLLVGENPPGNLGAMIKAIEKGFYFNIGGGKAKKSMVLAEDVANLIPLVAPIGGVYNLTDGLHPDFKTLSIAISSSIHKKTPTNLSLFIAKAIAYCGDLLGSKAPINSLKLKKITNDLTFDDTKAREALNWKPTSVITYIKKNSI